MAANIYIYCPAEGPGPDRSDLEDELVEFFGDAAEDCGAGSGASGFNLDYELAAGAEVHDWADRLKVFLAGIGVRAGTTFDVFPDGWEPGMEWRRVEVFGSDVRRLDSPQSASLHSCEPPAHARRAALFPPTPGTRRDCLLVTKF